jgi:hypothetical protein
MSFFRRFSPEFWRFDFWVFAPKGRPSVQSYKELAAIPIEVEILGELVARADNAFCPVCDEPVDAEVEPCPFCGLGFDSHACLVAHQRMVHRAAASH